MLGQIDDNNNGISGLEKSLDEDLKNLIVGSMQKKLKDGLIAQNQGNDSRESMTQIGG